jgi:peptidoglycan/LPS O-acetylase OafA/YrhL
MAYLVNFKLFAMSLGPDLEAFTLWFAANWRSESVHLWSLSVEEQFYIVYPLLLYLTAVRYRTAMLVAVVVISIAARTWFIEEAPYSYYAVLLPVCMEYFAWGCLFAWLEANNRLRRLNANYVLPASASVALVLIYLEFHYKLDGFYQFQTTHFQSPIAVCLGFFMWSVWNLDRSHPMARFLSFRPFVYFGEMSYTMYLVHLFTWDLWEKLGIDLPFSKNVDLMIGTWVLTTIISMSIWHAVEKPANQLKRYVPYARR